MRLPCASHVQEAEHELQAAREAGSAAAAAGDGLGAVRAECEALQQELESAKVGAGALLTNGAM